MSLRVSSTIALEECTAQLFAAKPIWIPVPELYFRRRPPEEPARRKLAPIRRLSVESRLQWSQPSRLLASQPGARARQDCLDRARRPVDGCREREHRS